jgi:hypothetical protein
MEQTVRSKETWVPEISNCVGSERRQSLTLSTLSFFAAVVLL